MKSLNTVFIAGSAGEDAKVFTGGKVAAMRLALNAYRPKQGATRPYKKEDLDESTTWVTVKAFGFVAEDAARVRRGDWVVVEGTLLMDTYQDKAGLDRSTLYVKAFKVVIGNSAEDRKIAREVKGTPRGGYPAKAFADPNTGDSAPAGGNLNDDIPF